MAAGIGALVARFGLAADAVASLQAIADMLTTDPAAPTTITERRRILDDHLADSLVALELEPVRSARRIVDLGAGPGLPGLALAAALPRAEIVMLDAVARKTVFIRRAIAAAALANARAEHARAEEWGAEHPRSADLATARALASPAVVLEYAAPILERGGMLVLWRGERDAEAEAEAAAAAAALGMQAGSVLSVQPYPTARHRHLHLFRKVRETPSRFPRRPGVAVRRPLGRGSDRSRR